jgi:hypothetical protein
MTKAKNNFVYVSSWDELTWIFNPNNPNNAYCCMIPWNNRLDIKQWIDDCCSDTVYCWNGTSTPAAYAQKWAYIAPHDERCYLIFSNQKDESMFCLKYTEQLKVKALRGLHSIWRDSREQ